MTATAESRPAPSGSSVSGGELARRRYRGAVPAVVVRVLGPFEVWRGREQIPFRPSKSRDLLALLTAILQ